MGAYTQIKGWLEIPPQRRDDAVALLKQMSKLSADCRLDTESWKLYQSGWHIQASAINGVLCIFFAAEIRTQYVELIQEQVIALSDLSYEDHEFEYVHAPNGLFYVDEDGTHKTPEMVWEVVEGRFDARTRCAVTG